jgi:acylphosphatase
MSEPVTRRIVARGRVQGVGFRYALRREAERLALRGWVRNRTDGSVEAVVQGDAAHVEAMLAWARRGPEAAQVASLDIEEAAGAFTSFEMRPTA